MNSKNNSYFLVNQACGALFIDIVNAFVNRKLNTILITGWVAQVQNPLNLGVRIVKLNCYNNSSVFRKLSSWFLFTFLLFFKILLSPSKSIWLITTNPPFAPWLTGLLKIKKCKVVLLIYDIYPEALVAINNVSKSHFFYRFWYSITQRTYKNASRIICIGETMTDYLVSQNKNLKSKISTIPNWNTIDFKSYEQNENKYKMNRNAENKIHVVYSGNLGATHDFNTILETAKVLSNDDRFIFSIIGHGIQKGKIKQFIQTNQLENIIWETWKPAREVPEVFLSADVFLLTLGLGLEKASIPSKTYDALAAGAALLVIAPKGNELEKLVQENNAGACFNPGEVHEVASWLRNLAENKEKLAQYKNASKKLSKNYSPANAKKFVEVLTSF